AALVGPGAATRLLDDRTARPVKVLWGRTHFHRFARLILRDETTGEATPVALDKPPVILGRGSPNDALTSSFCALGSDDHSLSRQHACLDLSGPRLWLTDLGSTNGTFLDGERLTAHVGYLLHNRAALQMGKLVLRVLFSE